MLCCKWVPVTTAWRVLGLRMEERTPVWRVAANIFQLLLYPLTQPFCTIDSFIVHILQWLHVSVNSHLQTSINT
jgi:hypothetical protein